MNLKTLLSGQHQIDSQQMHLAFKFRVLNYFLIIAVVFGLLIGGLGLAGVMKIGQVTPVADCVFALFNGFLVWYLRRDEKNFERVAQLFVLSTYILFVVALLTVATDEARIVWFYITVYVAYMILGIRSGIVYTVLSVLSIALLSVLFELQFTPTAISTFLFALIVLSLLARAHAIHIGQYESKLREQNDVLEKNVLELDEALVTARSASQVKSLFLANMSHEIRTPMNGVLSMAQVLENTALNEQQQGYLDAIKRSGDTLLVLIDDLLDLSKIESGTFNLHPDVFNCWDMIEDIMNQAEPLFDHQTTVFNADIADNLPTALLGDVVRLKQVIVNLITNAAKFTPAGNVNLKLSAEEDGENYRLIFQVEDNGIGIPEDKLQTIFTAFHQLSTDRIANKGVGLGLSICHKIIEKMHGTISVKSSEGKGSCFTVDVSLPVAKTEQAEKKTAASSPPDVLKILVFEDDNISRAAVTALLRANGHQVDTVVNGQAGIDVLRQSQFDVLLMDIHMPIMNGIEATKMIKDEKLSDAPIIGMTASVMNDEIDSYYEAGMDALVEKPINFEQLMLEVNQQLKK